MAPLLTGEVAADDLAGAPARSGDRRPTNERSCPNCRKPDLAVGLKATASHPTGMSGQGLADGLATGDIPQDDDPVHTTRC